MQEYFSDAIVLDRLANGDLDSRVIFFTKKFGKLVAKAKSARKITSKLSSHLEPGNLIQLRLIEKNGLQVVDALKTARLALPQQDLYLVSELLADAEPELGIWGLLAGGKFFWREALKILGWDPVLARCSDCSGKALSFHVKTQEFFCGDCSSRLPKDKVVYI